MGGKIDLAAHQGDAVVSALGGRNRVPPATEQAVKDHLAVPGNEDRKLMRSSSASDAPAESGNFDGGFAASAEQAARYRKARAKGTI